MTRPGLEFRQGKDFFPSLNRPDRLWAQQFSFYIGTGVLSGMGVNRPERDANHTPLFITEVKNK